MARPKKVVVKSEDVETKIDIIIEPEMYNGKKIVSSKEVEINSKKYKEITLEDGSTYTI
jgi:hypothetical protein